MTMSTDEVAELVPIDVVARQFGIRASTIRYYEERGLLEAVSRHFGRRWYGAAKLRRLAIIRYWQQSASMSLDDIKEILVGSESRNQWREVIDRRLAPLRQRIEEMEAARAFLEHVAFHHDKAPDGCPHFEELIWGRRPALDIQHEKPRRPTGTLKRARDGCSDRENIVGCRHGD
jgi:MerR family transcriptional regulator, copper efflux regulator